jgi:hypothetical protein
MVNRDQDVEYLRQRRLECYDLFDVHLSLHGGPHRMGKSQPSCPADVGYT